MIFFYKHIFPKKTVSTVCLSFKIKEDPNVVIEALLEFTALISFDNIFVGAFIVNSGKA